MDEQQQQQLVMKVLRFWKFAEFMNQPEYPKEGREHKKLIANLKEKFLLISDNQFFSPECINGSCTVCTIFFLKKYKKNSDKPNSPAI